MNRPKPDKPVISFDAATFEQMPEELRESLAVFFDGQEVAKAKAYRDKQKEYQNKQAETLLSCGSRWEEVALDADEDELMQELIIEKDLLDSDMKPFEWESHPSMEQEMLEIELIGQRPTLHQFYRDLYGLSLVSGSMMGYRKLNDFYKDEYEFSIISEEPTEVLVNHRDREHPYQLYFDYWEFVNGVAGETSFIYMGQFWQPENGFLIAKRNAMKTIGGFCVDIDRFEDETGQYFGAEWVMKTLVEQFQGTPEIEPNYLMLSGTGIQLWYVFGEQIPLLSAKKSPRRKKYDALLKKLYGWFDETLPPNRFKVDVPCATISHAFRAPGSPTKYHYPTRLFVKNGRFRKMINPLDLSDFLGGDLKSYDLEDWNQEEYERIKKEASNRDWNNRPATEKQRAYLDKLKKMNCIEKVPEKLTQAQADRLIKQAELVYTKRAQYRQLSSGRIKTTEGHEIARNKRHDGLYHYTLKRMHHETPAGSRYNAMFGLAGLAWNCGVPKSQVKNDLMGLLDTDWAQERGNDGKPLSRSDVEAALRGWNPLGALRTREQLEHRLKWHYNPAAKRNGRTREAHLAEWARPVRDAYIKAGNKDVVGGGRPKGSGTKEAEIKAYAAEHPTANHSEIARALGVSRPTVIKWLKR